jgi:hypothetical protein
MIIYARSPFFITVNESGQVGSKVEIFIANGGTSVPSTPTYTLTKSIPSSTQLSMSYNISEFIRETFNTFSPDESANDVFKNVQVKRYKETSVGSYTLLDTVNYVAVNGYSSYQQGVNYDEFDNIFVCLANPSVKIRYKEGISSTYYPYINVAVDFTVNSSSKIDVTYRDLNGANPAVVTYDTNTRTVLKIPVRTTSSNYNAGNTITLDWKPEGSGVATSKTFIILPICEPKYTPVVCQFINRYGGWQFLTFFKAKSEAINASSSSYNLLPDSINYNTVKPQTASFNINGKKSVRLNTGFVEETHSEIIQDLLLAETILLDYVPVEIKTQSTDIKTSLKDKNINYELEFEYAFNLINNVI